MAMKRLSVPRALRPFCFLLLTALLVSGAAAREPQQATAVFTATDADFPNPERGFYHAARTHLDALDPAEIAAAYESGYRLIYASMNLEPFRDADLPESYLQALDAGFATARAGGIKLIIRAAYNNPRSETEYRQVQDAPLARVLGHLAQLKPVFHRNADVIAFVQAGFIGAWGEWHTSSNNLTDAPARAQIRDALLDAAPETRFVQFRYPRYISDWRPNLPSLSAALNGAFRIGFHSDCFLASTTDVGTYSEDAGQRATEQQAMDALGDLTVFGGETCNPADQAGATPRTACSDILSEGARYNLTYLNDGYYRPLFHDNWIKGGCMTEVRRRIGYRFALVSTAHDARASRGGALHLSIVIRNSGWARLYNPRSVEIILSNARATRRIETSGADPRTWLPGTESTQTLGIALPHDLPAGRYDVLLALPDADARLKDDPRFAIRMANAGDGAKGQGWDAALGAFALGTSVSIR